MDSVSKIKNLFEKKKKDGDKQANSGERRLSVTIKEKVQMYEKQVEESEKMRKHQNLFEITRKFGLNKYLNREKMKEGSVTTDDTINNNENSNSSAFNISENRLEKFIKEMQIMCENYEKEIEVLKSKCESNNVGTNLKNCHLCDKLINVIDHKKALLTEKEDELMALKEEMKNMQKKYDDLELHINTMMDSLVSDSDANISPINKEIYKSMSNFHLDCFDDNYRHSQSRENIFDEKSDEIILKQNKENSEIQKLNNNTYPDDILSELITELIIKDYISSLSININSLNNKLLTNHNFISFLTTCFTNYKNTNLTLSIYHEYLQDIIIQIYISFRKYKQSKDQANYSWLISEEDINEEIIKATVDDIFSYYLNLNNKNTLENIDEYFERCFEKFNFSTKKKFENLKENVKETFMKQVIEYHKIIKEDIAKIVRLCRNYIHAGKLFYRSNIMYDYWKLFHDATTFEQGNNFISDNYTTEIRNFEFHQSKNGNNKICYYQSAEAPDYSDYLINFIKFNNSKIDTVYINGAKITSHEDDNDFILKLPMSMILSSILINGDFIQRLKSLSIMNTRLEDDALCTLNKIIEFSQSLQTLDLSYNNLDSKGIRIISESLKINNSILTLILAYDKITSNATFYLSEMLLKNSTITNLNLSGNNVRELGLQSLVNILINSNASIKSLDLSNNNLHREDFIIINNLIMKNCDHFQTLNLSYNKFDSDCVNTFGIALRNNYNLKTLYLNRIGLDAESTPYFMQHMMEFNIEELYLDENNLGEVGGVLFANVIKTNHKFKTVSLRKTNQNSNSLSCISHALELEIKSNKLKNIYLDENEFDYKEINNIVNIFKLHNMNGNGIFLPKIYFSAEYLEEVSINKLISLEFDNFILV